MSHVGHKIVKCRQCGEVIMQCRCAEPQKTVEWVDHCAACLKRNRQLFKRLYADKDDPYTECAKAMCEMCDGQPNAVVKPISIGNGKYFHTMHNSPFRKFCKASPIWEKVKK